MCFCACRHQLECCEFIAQKGSSIFVSNFLKEKNGHDCVYGLFACGAKLRMSEGLVLLIFNSDIGDLFFSPHLLSWDKFITPCIIYM